MSHLLVADYKVLKSEGFYGKKIFNPFMDFVHKKIEMYRAPTNVLGIMKKGNRTGSLSSKRF